MIKKILVFLVCIFAINTSCFAGDILPNGINQEDLYNFLSNTRDGIMNGCYGDAGLAISATDTANILTTSTVSYTIDGVWYSCVSSADIDISVVFNGTPAAQAVATYAKYLLSVNAAGTFAVTKGNEGGSAADAKLPRTPDDSAVLGYYQVLTGAATTYTPGTTKLSAANITDTYVDLRAPNSGKSAVSLTGL